MDCDPMSQAISPKYFVRFLSDSPKYFVRFLTRHESCVREHVV